MIWKRVNDKFQYAKTKIDDHIHRFEDEARIEIDYIAVCGFQTLQHGEATSGKPANVQPGPVFKVDFTQNNFFTRREKEVAFLCEHVRNARKNGQRGICTIHSIGGVGKTQLALEYAHRFRAEFECDGSTMTYDELLGVDLVRRDYVGSTMYAMYKPGYRWYYLEKQKPSEVCLFKNFDSSTDMPVKSK